MCGVKFSNIKGAILLELMLAVSLSLLVIAGLGSVYIKVHQAFLVSEELNQQRLSAEKMFSMINDEISMAGQIGCAAVSSNFKVDSYQREKINDINYLLVTQDSLIVRYQAFPSVILLNDMPSDSTIITDKGVLIHVGESLIISDCRHAEINRVASVRSKTNMQIITFIRPLHHKYLKNAEVGKFISHEYRLENIHGQASLVSVDSVGRLVVLVNNVVALHFNEDKGGVQYDFQTATKHVTKLWVGYAEKV